MQWQFISFIRRAYWGTQIITRNLTKLYRWSCNTHILLTHKTRQDLSVYLLMDWLTNVQMIENVLFVIWVFLLWWCSMSVMTDFSSTPTSVQFRLKGFAIMLINVIAITSKYGNKNACKKKKKEEERTTLNDLVTSFYKATFVILVLCDNSYVTCPCSCWTYCT